MKTANSYGWMTLTAALAAITAPVSTEAGDVVELVSGVRYDNCEVLSARWDQVQYKLANAPQAQTQPGEKVLSITRESSLLQGARTAIDAGGGLKTIKDLEAIVAAPGVDDWRKAEARFLLGRAHRVGGDMKAATEAFKAYIEKHKAEKDWFLPFATYELADAQLTAKQPGTAALTFKELAQFGGLWVLRSKLGEALCSLAQGPGEAMKARGLCDEVVKSREATPQLKNQALVIRAKVLLLQKNPSQAIKELTDGFFSAAKSEVEYSAERAEATLLMGRAYLATEGKDAQDQAEIWFLRVPALYRRYQSTYGEACDQLVALYEKAGNANRANEWKARKQITRPTPPGAPPASEPQSAPAASPASGSKKPAGSGKAAGPKGK